MKHVGLVILACLALGRETAVAQAPRDDDAVQLVFLAKDRPVLLRLDLSIDGKSIVTNWNNYLQKWFAFLDTNDDGVLDMAEAERAPDAATFMQLASQSVFFNPAQNPRAKVERPNFRSSPMGVRLAEFQAYYRGPISPLQVQAQSDTAAFQKEVSTALFKALDADRDGKLSKSEAAAAVNALRKFDLEDNEWIMEASLAPTLSGTNQPFVLRQAPMQMQGEFKSDSFVHIRPGDGRLPGELLARYGKNGSLSREQSGLDAEGFTRLDRNADGRLDTEELTQWHQRPADIEMAIPIAKLGGPPVKFQITRIAPALTSAISQNPMGAIVTLGDAQINLFLSANPSNIVRLPQQVQNLFRQADPKEQGFVTMTDVQRFGPLTQLFPIADRDRNGKLTMKELQAYLDLQTLAADAFATVTVADQGRVLFQYLDANSDGRLSLRELQNTWSRLSALDANGDGQIEQSEITRRFELGAMPGQGGVGVGGVVAVSAPRQAPMMRPVNYGQYLPPWFSKMDKNGDGDVSRREFLGLPADFARLDTDGDGLLSAEEAGRSEPRPPVRRDR